MTADNIMLNTLAKLLANENINVVREPIDTASFNIVNRTLTLPMWKELTPEIESMLAVHEIGHALWTTPDYLEKGKVLDFKGAHGFLNILEDVRSEKLTKRKYPGTRKTFNLGYRALNDLDFFGVKDRSLADLHLLDRINLYFKVGCMCGVKFTSEEKAFVVRTEQTESVDDVVQLAQDIFNFLKLQKEKEQQQQNQLDNDPSGMSGIDDQQDETDQDEDDSFDSTSVGGDDADEDDFEDGDDDSDSSYGDDEEDEDGDESGSLSDEFNDLDDKEHSFRDFSRTESEEDDVGEPTTNGELNTKLTLHADQSTEYKYWNLGAANYDPMIPYTSILADVDRYVSLDICNPLTSFDIQATKQFMADTQNNVDYMVKEFEMKKAATSYKRTSVSKTGSLDMRRVWSYKTNNDLFRRVSTVKEGKSHGMVFLLDWSSSMRNTMDKTVDQLINLVSFCRRSQIAHEVLAFTSESMSKEAEEFSRRELSQGESTQDPTSLMFGHSGFALLQLFNSNMTNAEFHKMVMYLRTRKLQRLHRLGSTPLNEALVHMYNHIGAFQRRHAVEKTTFITLTDGEGGSLGYIQSTRHVRLPDSYSFNTINTRHFVVDKYTKKTYEITGDGTQQTNTILRMIKDYHECTVVGFILVPKSKHSVQRAIFANTGDVTSALTHTTNRVTSEIRSLGYSSIPGAGRDDLFVVPCDNRIYSDDLQVNGDQTAKSIASKLTKHMTKQKTSRILLNKFIAYVA